MESPKALGIAPGLAHQAAAVVLPSASGRFNPAPPSDGKGTAWGYSLSGGKGQPEQAAP